MKSSSTFIPLFLFLFLFSTCTNNDSSDSTSTGDKSAADPAVATTETASQSPEIIYYIQEFLGPGPNPAPLSLAPIWSTRSPENKPYTTQVYISSFNMGPHYPNLLPNTPYIHVNDIPLDDPILQSLWSDTDSLRNNGVEVLMMLGGAGANYPQTDQQGTNKFGYNYNNNTWGVLWPGTNVPGITYYKDTDMDSRYYGFILNTLINYKFDGIGLDFETGNVSGDNVSTLIANLRQDYRAKTERNLYVSLTPVASGLISGYGIGGFNYQTIYSTSGADINAFNGQFYNGFGSVTTPTSYESVINATWTYEGQTQSYPPSVIVLGAQTSELSGSKTSGTYQQFLNTVTTLSGKYPNFGGVFAWVYSTPVPGNPANPAQLATDVYEAIQAGREN